MGFRELAGDLARSTSGVWRGIADAVDPVEPPPVVADVDVDGPVDGDGAIVGGAADGAMLVPVDTWTRILEQLGHLHEAGQQLADARERAARAETENRFLREQLRTGATGGRSTRRSASAARVDPATQPETVVDRVLIEPRRTRVRRQVSGWLSP